MFGACKSNSSILIDELDYKFIGECENDAKLEAILTVLRSGEEGVYPDLIAFTETRIAALKPGSELLHGQQEEQCAGKSSVSHSDKEGVAKEMEDWQNTMKEVDSKLTCNGLQVGDGASAAGLPPVRQPGQKTQVDAAVSSCASSLTGNLPPSELENLATVEKLKGNDAFRTGDYAEALNYYNRSLSIVPLGAVHNNRAAVYLKLERFEEAIHDSRLVLQEDSKNVKAMLRLAIALEAAGNQSEAAQCLVDLLKIEPSNKRAQELLTNLQNKMSASAASDSVQATKTGTKLLIEEIDSSAVSHDAGQVSSGQSTDDAPLLDAATNGDAAKDRKGKRLNIIEVDSRAELDKVASMDLSKLASTESSAKSSVEHGVASGDGGGKMDNVSIAGGSVEAPSSTIATEQKTEIAVACKDIPAEATRLKEEGNDHFKRGKFAVAVENYTLALNALQGELSAYNPVEVAALLSNRAAAHLKVGKCKECIDDATQSIALAPTPKAFMRRAKAQESLERYEHSYVDNQAVLQLDPTAVASQQALSRLNTILRQQHGSLWRDKLPSPFTGDLSNQHQRHSQATNPVPVQPIPAKKTETFEDLKKKGNDFVKQGKFSDAASCYSDCILLRGDEVSAFTNRALCYIKLNKPAEAIDDCSHALEMTPKNVKALFRRAQAKKMVAAHKDSLADLKKLLDIEPENAAGKALYGTVKDIYRKELMSMRSAKK